ncbi:MAG: TfoX/Sxy family protein [Myxococcales bacterium]|nr:TfoX/Sxy family protein [Myxococcales bacterium]
MAYDERLAARVRALLAKGGHEVVEKTMFGGLCFMVGGHMCCGLAKEALMLRVGKDAYPDVLDLRHARPMTFTGRPLAGYVYVDPAGYKTDAALARWLERGTDFVATLPLRVARKPSRTVAAKRPRSAAQATATRRPRPVAPRRR